ncbi:hypothetical protein DSM25559_4532 [Agrobacterium rosae]|uniref:Uncharacterized protein n=1 Tax=Agrobacterium rosae TaxID=1972867 RepID=A0A1R3U6F6_9HYPH|nr:hypothetical protein DSM25559_4532 [Agrobacterium rosae]
MLLGIIAGLTTCALWPLNIKGAQIYGRETVAGICQPNLFLRPDGSKRIFALCYYWKS